MFTGFKVLDKEEARNVLEELTLAAEVVEKQK